MLRAFSVFTGVIALSFTYALAKGYFSREVAVYTVFTVGVGYFFTYYMRDMRPYGLLVMVVAINLWLYERVTSPEESAVYTALWMRPEKVNDLWESIMFQTPDGDSVNLYLTHNNHTGEVLTAGLAWELDAGVPLYTYSVGYYVRDASGTVAQFDVGIEAPQGCTVQDLSVPQGEYEILLGVYAWETGENLMMGDGETFFNISDTASRVPTMRGGE